MATENHYLLDKLVGAATISPRSAHQRSRSGQPDRNEADPPSDRFRRNLGGRQHSFNAPPTPKRRDRERRWHLGARKECVVSLGIRSRQSRPFRSSRRLGLVAAAVVIVAGCSNKSDELPLATSTTGLPSAVSSTTSGSTVPAVTATTPPAEDVVIVDRYKKFWEARLAANQAPANPDFPDLRTFATGEQLDQVILETRQRRDKGLAIKKPSRSAYERRVKLVSIEGDSAVVQDCVTDDLIVYKVATGEVVDDATITRNVSATMRRVDGTWRLAAARLVQEWKGVAGCALSSDFS